MAAGSPRNRDLDLCRSCSRRANSGLLLGRRLCSRGRSWRLRDGGGSVVAPAGAEHVAGAVKPALEAVAAAAGAVVASLPQGLQLAAEVAQQIQHGLLQLLHAVADDADVA